MSDTRHRAPKPRNQTAFTLLCIAMLGLLLFGVQLFMTFQANHNARGQQLKEIREQIALVQQQDRTSTCALFSKIPPDHGPFDVIRAQINCGTYVPPKAAK